MFQYRGAVSEFFSAKWKHTEYEPRSRSVGRSFGRAAGLAPGALEVDTALARAESDRRLAQILRVLRSARWKPDPFPLRLACSLIVIDEC